MSLLKLLAVGLLSAGSVLADSAQDPASESAQQTSDLKVKTSVSFPQSEVFGVKLVNGYPTEALVAITNDELESINVQIVGGSIWSPELPQQESLLMRNLSATTYKGDIGAGLSETFSYKFTIDMHAQDVLLKLAALVQDGSGEYHTMSVYNEQVSVVEAPTSIFDPQIIFLYLVLAAGFAGTSFFVYKTWVSTLFPQQKRRAGKGGDRAKTSTRGTKKVDPDEQVPVVGADGPAVASGAKSYDESWIPAAHLQRPNAKRIRSGTPSGKAKKVAA